MIILNIKLFNLTNNRILKIIIALLKRLNFLT